jgi:hypothetical protein
MKVYHFLLAAALLASSCHFGPFHVIQGNGNVTQDDRQVGDFQSIDARGFMNVYLTQGDGYHVRLEGESNILPYISTRIEGSKLIVGTEHAIDVNTTHDLNVYVTMPKLNNITLSGSGDIIGKNTLTNTDPMSFGLNGSGNVHVSVDAPGVETSLAGSGHLYLNGQTQRLKVEIAGSATFSGDSLKSEEAQVSIMGSGDAYVFASVSLNVTIGGSGDVYYWGNPSVSSKVFGSGSLNKKD